MKILVFDTETNGKIKHVSPDRAESYLSFSDFPMLVSLAYKIFEIDFDISGNLYEIRPIDSFYQLIQPLEGYPWDKEAETIHNISQSKAIDQGIPASVALKHFKNKLKDMNVVVGHNLSFDKSVIMANTERLFNMNELNFRGATIWPPHIQDICTMKASTNYCKLPSQNPKSLYKFPKLIELFQTLFASIPFGTLHNALVDVEVASKCFFELLRRRVIVLDLRGKERTVARTRSERNALEALLLLSTCSSSVSNTKSSAL